MLQPTLTNLLTDLVHVENIISPIPYAKILILSCLLQVHNSTEFSVVLSSVQLSTSGIYRCEVSGEAPYFETVADQAHMLVVGKFQSYITLSVGKTNIMRFESATCTVWIVEVGHLHDLLIFIYIDNAKKICSGRNNVITTKSFWKQLDHFPITWFTPTFLCCSINILLKIIRHQ